MFKAGRPNLNRDAARQREQAVRTETAIVVIRSARLIQVTLKRYEKKIFGE